MLPLRLVLDTNIVVSAALRPDGLQRTVLLIALARPARLYVTAPILSEYRMVPSRRELGIRKALRQQLLQLIADRSYEVFPTRALAVALDPVTTSFSNVRTLPAPTTS